MPYNVSKTITRFPFLHRESHIVDHFLCSQLVAEITKQFYQRYWSAPHIGWLKSSSSLVLSSFIRK